MRAEVELKTQPEIARLRRSAAVVREVLEGVGGQIRPGTTTAQIAAWCTRMLERRRAVPASELLGGFPGPVSVSVNNVAAHGVPGHDGVEDGDLVTVDICAVLDGWFSDAAWTFGCGNVSSDARRLVRAAWRAAAAGVRSAVAGRRLGDVAAAVQKEAREAGCTVLPEFAGHGIGRRLHEGPTVRYVGRKSSGQQIVPGMVITVEPILSLGAAETYELSNRWAHATRDGSLSAQFEHTVSVTVAGYENLTRPDFETYVDFPPFF